MTVTNIIFWHVDTIMVNMCKIQVTCLGFVIPSDFEANSQAMPQP